MRKLVPLSLVLALGCTKEQSKPTTGSEEAVKSETTKEVAKAKEAPPAAPAIVEVTISSSSPEAVEQLKQGRDLVDNIRQADAIAFFKKAIELDPNFALAHAYLGMLTPGSEGLALLEQASSLAAKLPEAERTLIEIPLANRKGETAKADELTGKLLTLAPTDWHAHSMAGTRAFDKRDYATASTELKKAAELNPKVGSVHNLLGYAALFQGHKDEAIAAMKRYAELSPTEPNPHDSLGDMLLASGKLEEAEAAYKKALEVSPTFFFAWTGVAETRGLRGDWTGAEEALAKGRQGMVRPEDKLQLGVDAAWLQLSQGKTKDALKVIDQVIKEAETAKYDVGAAFAPIEKAGILNESGKSKDALKLVSAAWQKGEKAKLPGGTLRELRIAGLHVQAMSQAKLANKVEAEKVAAQFDEIVKASPGSIRLQSQQHDVHGLVALASKDAKGAVEHFKQCINDDTVCFLHRIEALEQAGDKAGAAEAKQILTATPLRDFAYLYARAKLGSIPSPSAAN